MNYKFEKSICEKYKIKLDNGDYMNITIDESGLFQASGSFGSYSHTWSSHGCKTFKHFLLRISSNTSYFLSKISKSDYFYPYKTKEDWKQRILHDRRGTHESITNLTKEQARALWDIVNSIDYYSAERCLGELLEHKIVSDLYSEPWYCFEPHCDYPPEAICFLENIMPIFSEILEKEINKCFDNK